MEIPNFFINHKNYRSVEIWSFESLPTQVIAFETTDVGRAELSSKMRELSARQEIGVLNIAVSMAPRPLLARRLVLTSKAVLQSFQLLAAPSNRAISGIVLNLDIGKLTITSGAMPFSIFVSLGTQTWGKPEYPMAEYELFRPQLSDSTI